MPGILVTLRHRISCGGRTVQLFSNPIRVRIGGAAFWIHTSMAAAWLSREVLRQVRWQQLAKRRHDRTAYIDLRTKFVTGSRNAKAKTAMTADEQRQLKQLEAELCLDDILLYRHQVTPDGCSHPTTHPAEVPFRFSTPLSQATATHRCACFLFVAAFLSTAVFFSVHGGPG